MNFSNEPALTIAGGGAIVGAVIAVVVSFGVPITPDEKGAILALTALVIPSVTAVAIRSRVTPVASQKPAPVITVTVDVGQAVLGLEKQRAALDEQLAQIADIAATRIAAEVQAAAIVIPHEPAAPTP